MADRTNQSLDAHLVEAARRGDVGSFGQLYERHYAGVFGVARSVLGDRSRAEDAAQEAFAVACANLQKLRRSDRFAWWLRGICRKIARNMLRRGRRTVEFRDAPYEEDEAKDEELSEAVREAVDRLHPPAREVVILHYFSGMTHDEIANMLLISPQAVHGRLVRARRKIAKDLHRTHLGA